MAMTVAEAAQRLGKSERTVRRLIESGRIEAKKTGGRWVVHDLGKEELGVPDGTMQALVAQLRSEVDFLRERNQELLTQLEESRNRQDTIILRLTEQQRALEDLRQPFWRRWTKRSGGDAEQGGRGAGE